MLLSKTSQGERKLMSSGQTKSQLSPVQISVGCLLKCIYLHFNKALSNEWNKLNDPNGILNSEINAICFPA